MTPGITALLVMAFCVVLFVTNVIPSVLAACIGCILMVIFNVCSFDVAFSGFSNSIVILMFAALIVGDAMFNTGTAQLIGRQVVRFSHNSQRVFLLVMCVVAGVLSMFLANTAVIAAFLPIIDSVCRVSDNMKRRDLTQPLALASMFGGACTLIGCTPQLTANAILLSMSDMEMEMFTLFGPGVCILVVFILYVQFVGLKLGKRIWGDRPEADMDIDPEIAKAAVVEQYDKKKIIIMMVIVVLMIVSYVGAWISTTMTAVLAAVLCLLTGCTNVTSVRKNMNWDTVIFLAACLGLSEGLNASGAGDLISEFMSPLVTSVSSPFFTFAILVFMSLFISNFITNSAAIIIVLPVALPICSAFGYNPMAFCLGITYAASFACSTPLAASQVAMTLVAGYKFSDYFRYTFPLAIITFICILIFVPIFFPLVLA